jgi:hypothetical protein
MTDKAAAAERAACSGIRRSFQIVHSAAGDATTWPEHSVNLEFINVNAITPHA